MGDEVDIDITGVSWILANGSGRVSPRTVEFIQARCRRCGRDLTARRSEGVSYEWGRFELKEDSIRLVCQCGNEVRVTLGEFERRFPPT